MDGLGVLLLTLTGIVLIWVLIRFAPFSPWAIRIRPASEKEQLIVIARFLSSDHVKNRNIAQELQHTLEKSIAELRLENIRVEVDHTRLLSDDMENAQKLGRSYRATVVVWGTDTGERTTLNMLNLASQADAQKADPFMADLSKYRVDDNTFIIVPPAHNRFSTKHFSENAEFISYLVLGHLYDVENDYPDAIQVLAKAVASINPAVPPLEGLAQTYHRLGWIYHVPLHNPPISLRYYNKAIEQEPSFVDSYNNRGVLRLFSNDPIGALADFDQALKLNPRLVGALMSRGTLYNQLGKLELAVEDYDRFLELAGDSVFNIAAFFGRGSARAKLNEFDEAISDFCKALAMDPDDDIKAAILYSIANSLKNKALKSQDQGDKAEMEKSATQAICDFKSAIALFANNDDKANAYYETAVLHAMIEQYQEAVKALDLSIKLYQDIKRMNEAIAYRHSVLARMEEVQKS